MNRGPIPGLRSKVDFVAKAVAAWGEDLPREIRALAEACCESTASAVAKRIGYSPSAVSYVLSRKYQEGDMARVFAAIRGALMGETVLCPILGDIGRDRCLREQATPFAATNSTRARLSHACKTCPNRQQKDSA